MTFASASRALNAIDGCALERKISVVERLMQLARAEVSCVR